MQPRFIGWVPVGTHSFLPTDRAIEIGTFDLSPGQDTIWVKITQLNDPESWPWSYGILSWRNSEGVPLGSVKAYSNRLGEVFRLGNGLAPLVGTGSIWFEPRGFNLGWLKAGFPWELQFEAQSGSSTVSDEYWSRIPGTLAPSTAGDGIDLGSGGLTAASLSLTEGSFVVQGIGDTSIDYGHLICGDKYDTSSASSSSVELQAGAFSSYGRLFVQGPSDTAGSSPAIRVIKGAELIFQVSYSGAIVTPSTLSAQDLELRSSDPAFYKSSNDQSEYVGPSLSLMDEIVRLEFLVKDLYDKLRMTPPAGWEVWDGNTDLAQSRGKKKGQI